MGHNRKFRAPRSKRPMNIQAPNSKEEWHALSGAWLLELLWSLELGRLELWVARACAPSFRRTARTSLIAGANIAPVMARFPVNRVSTGDVYDVYEGKFVDNGSEWGISTTKHTKSTKLDSCFNFVTFVSSVVSPSQRNLGRPNIQLWVLCGDLTELHGCQVWA